MSEHQNKEQPKRPLINRITITGTTSRQLYEMSLRTAEATSLPPLSHNVLVGALVSEAWSTGRYKTTLKALAEARQRTGQARQGSEEQ